MRPPRKVRCGAAAGVRRGRTVSPRMANNRGGRETRGAPRCRPRRCPAGGFAGVVVPRYRAHTRQAPADSGVWRDRHSGCFWEGGCPAGILTQGPESRRTYTFAKNAEADKPRRGGKRGAQEATPVSCYPALQRDVCKTFAKIAARFKRARAANK